MKHARLTAIISELKTAHAAEITKLNFELYRQTLSGPVPIQTNIVSDCVEAANSLEQAINDLQAARRFDTDDLYRTVARHRQAAAR